MNKHYKFTKIVLSLLLSVAMLLISTTPLAMQVSAAPTDTYSRVADPHTLDQWKNYFGMQTNHPQDLALSTEYAGGVWTDKSVFMPGSIPNELTRAKYNNNSFVVTDKEDNFLVSLSAIASNKEITGYSTIPTDTVFVLDMSSSMRYNDDNGQSAIDELVAATNSAIYDLLELNKNNRIAVVLYAGNVNQNFTSDADGTTQVLLPLDTYTLKNNQEYLVSTSSSGNANWAIRVANNVVGSNGTVQGSKATSTGTFIQDGIYEAMKLFLGAEPTVTSGVQAGTERLPIMVLMTDGEPTIANNDYDGNDAGTDLGRSIMRDYNGNTGTNTHRDTIAFMTMLTAAYAKKQIASHYGDALMYTLAYGDEVVRLDEARSVMDPENSSDTLNGLWTSFLNDQTVTVYRYGNRGNYSYYTTKNASSGASRLVEADKFYVNEYYSAEEDAEFAEAFDAIVDEIIIQSKYYPTYVEIDHDHDGYLTFVDKIGKYMQISDIKGIVVGDRLFSGAALSSSLDATDDALGTVENPTDMGNNFIWSVKERLGITDTAVAQALVADAYKHGQLAYTNDQNFSHYIGWFSDATGKYVDFWHEGMTEADINAAVANGATHIMKSYGFLGDTAIIGGLSKTDMMYMTVRIATEIASGESILTWKLPASLIPTVTYEVSVNVDADGNITEVTDLKLENNTAENPIRLLYEVELQEDIYDWNLKDKVPQSYANSTENKKGGYVFYSNKWTSDTDDTTLNTYSHFEPSEDNERYYYTMDSLVYADNQGTVYTGGNPSQIAGTYYRQFSVYEKLNNGTIREHKHYEEITATSLDLAEPYENNQWVIPKNTVHRYYDFENTLKYPNTTDTMQYSDHPFIVAGNNHYYTYSTQGNNGMLSVVPATGLRLSKNLTEIVEGASNTFTFTILGDTSNAVVVRLDEQGREASRAALASNGEVVVNAGETVYVIGLTAGTYTVTESNHDDYDLSAIMVDNAPQTGQATVVVTEQNINDVNFVNEPKGYGNLMITKEVSHALEHHMVPADVLNQEFKVIVNVGTELKGKELDTLVGTTTGKVTVGDDGSFELTIKHGQTVEILNLPGGTIATVTEVTTGLPAYYQYKEILTRDHTGLAQDNDNQVQIYTGQNATAVVYNTYKPEATDPVNINFNITKNFNATGFSGDANFTFKLQQWIIPQGETEYRWDDMDSSTLNFTASGQQATVLPTGMGGITYNEAGQYAYQVVEYIPDVTAKVPGVTYDRTLYTFTVTVKDNNGKLVAEVTDTAGNPINGTYDVSFTNTYYTAPISIDIIKNVVDTSDNTETLKSGFKFNVTEEVYDVTSDTWVATGTTASVYSDAAGEARYAKIFEKDDAATYPLYYRYSIAEENTNLTNWVYATNTEYAYFVIDVDGSGNLVSNPTDESRNVITSASKPTFTNTYNPTDATVDLDLEVVKDLQGRAINADEFTFAVFENGQYSFTDTTNAKLVGKNKQDGAVDFEGVLSFDKIGTYEFDVVEINTGLGGVTYTERVYDLVVEVTDNGAGALVATHYFEDAVVEKVTFTNTYKAAPVEAYVEGTKKLTGRPMLSGEFDFQLTEVADELGTDLANAEVLYAENGTASGDTASFKFGGIYFDKVGTRYYKLEEVAGTNDSGVTYATNTYIMKVEVTDNGAGQLVASSSIVSSSDNSTSVVFANSYKPAKAVTAIQGVKKLDGRTLNANEFSFTIDETEADFTTLVSGGLHETVQNSGNGVIAFPNIEFTDAGARYYVIKEVVGTLSNVTYDKAEYRVTVSATDNQKGTLVISTDVLKVVTELDNNNQEQTVILPASSVVFENTYTPSHNPPGYNPQPTPTPTATPPATISPLTGDSSMIGLWFAPLLISLGAFVLITFFEDKKERK